MMSEEEYLANERWSGRSISDSDSDEDPATKWRRNMDARQEARMAREAAARAGDSGAGAGAGGARAGPRTTCMYGDLLTLGLSRLYV